MVDGSLLKDPPTSFAMACIVRRRAVAVTNGLLVPLLAYKGVLALRDLRGYVSCLSWGLVFSAACVGGVGFKGSCWLRCLSSGHLCLDASILTGLYVV